MINVQLHYEWYINLCIEIYNRYQTKQNKIYRNIKYKKIWSLAL